MIFVTILNLICFYTVTQNYFQSECDFYPNVFVLRIVLKMNSVIVLLTHVLKRETVLDVQVKWKFQRL